MEHHYIFPKEFRLKKTKEFRQVYESRNSLANSFLIVYVGQNGRDYSRLGLSVSRKVGNAVIRNSWKRRLREVFRQSRLQLPPGWDIVVLPQKGAVLPAFSELKKAFLTLLGRLERKMKNSSFAE
ncbi:MAG: ribonuclease P protein component [Thermoguttaceae bacterium]